MESKQYIVSYSGSYPHKIDGFDVIETIYLPQITVLREMANNAPGEQSFYRACRMFAVWIDHCLRGSVNFYGIFWGDNDRCFDGVRKQLMALGLYIDFYYDEEGRIKRIQNGSCAIIRIQNGKA